MFNRVYALYPVRRLINFYSTKTRDVNIQKPNKLDFQELKFKTKVPQEPVENSHSKKEDSEKDFTIQIDAKTIALLERLSLVDLDGKEAFQSLQDSIQFADKITPIDTTNIEPLYTVLEEHSLELREDEVTDGNIREDILKNAKITEEDYFVAPPGNIPLEQEEKKFD